MFPLRLALWLSVVVYLGCGSETSGPEPSGPSGQAEIGPAGGSVTSADGKATITIPAGALATTETIAIAPMDLQNIPSAFDDESVEKGYVITPEGLTFAMPVTVCIESDQTPTQADGSIMFFPEWMLTEDDTSAAENLDSHVMDVSEVDDRLLVCGDTDHLSPFVTVSDRDKSDEPLVAIHTFWESLSTAKGAQFSVTTKLEGSINFAVNSYHNDSDPADIQPVGEPSITGDATETFARFFADCLTEGSVPVNATLRLDTRFTLADLDRVQLQARGHCPTTNDPAPVGQPRVITAMGGTELSLKIDISGIQWADADDDEFPPLLSTGTGTKGTGGTRIYDIDTESEVRPVDLGSYWGSFAIGNPSAASSELRSGVFSYGGSGGFFLPYDETLGDFNQFGQLIEFQGYIFDAYPFNGDAGSAGLTYAGSGFSLKFFEWNEEFGDFGVSSRAVNLNQVGGGFDGEIRGGIHLTSVWKRVAGDVLILTGGDISAPGAIYLADSADTQANATYVADVGMDPRRARYCRGLVATSNFGSDDLTLLRWDGMSASVLQASITVGDGPVGIDMIELPSGNIAISSAGFNDNTMWVTVVDPFGGIIANEGYDAPGTCGAPGHATWITRGSEIHLVLSCNGSEEIYVQQFTF